MKIIRPFIHQTKFSTALIFLLSILTVFFAHAQNSASGMVDHSNYLGFFILIRNNCQNTCHR